MKKVLLFDIDGTLLLTGGTGRIAFERAVHELYGISSCWGTVYPDGKTDQEIFSEIMLRTLGRSVEGLEWDVLIERYAAHFEKEVDHTPGFRVMPGFPALLEQLIAREDLLLGIATGNVRQVSDSKFRRAGLVGYFRFMATATDSHIRSEIVETAVRRAIEAAGKPVEKENIIVIGDAIADITAARKAGVKVFSVATGSTPKSALAAFHPDHLFDDLSDAELFLKTAGI